MSWHELVGLLFLAFLACVAIFGLICASAYAGDPVRNDIRRLIAKGHGEDCVIATIKDWHGDKMFPEHIESEVRRAFEDLHCKKEEEAAGWSG